MAQDCLKILQRKPFFAKLRNSSASSFTQFQTSLKKNLAGVENISSSSDMASETTRETLNSAASNDETTRATFKQLGSSDMVSGGSHTDRSIMKSGGVALVSPRTPSTSSKRVEIDESRSRTVSENCPSKF